ncbi:hypothetical protein JZO86_06935 [Enterococcus ureasiticus]|uniref:T7SS effector LXG polymorphic toxin n=1 Tax=Enterococcus ureasiticus TaxID=903984 RepID=UPI001A8E7F6A|nr:T7SS effector LXG polymorphic toxin [Enterococcus ureasiticus]MBO0473436.1 hypothetical protein [Enterococcus ureasiticus]
MVKMVIGEVQTQTEQIKAFGKTYSQALESVSSTTQGILLVVGMSGQGMDSIKNYISSTYPALCKAVILHSEATAQANEQYLEGYTSQCGSEDLDSEELQDQINEADRLIQGFQSSKDSFAQAKRGLSEDSSKLMGMIFQAAINNMDAGITRNQAKKARIEEKLRKFLAFCDKSPSYFDGLKSSEELMTRGMQALGVDGSGNVGAGSWNGKGFSLKDTAWIKDVNKNWNDRVERRDKQLLDGCKIIHVFDEKYGKDVYMFEKDGYHYALNEDDLSADLKKLIKKYGLDVLELSPTEMSKRVNDFQKSGRDYFSGDKVGMPGFGALAHGQDFMGKMQESGLWDAMWALGLTGAAVRNAQIYDKKVRGADIGVVQTRINAANGQTRFTPLRKSGEPVSAGFDHVFEGHFDRPLANSRSIFYTSSENLKQILKSPNVVKSPVIEIPGGQYKRIVDTGEIIGNTALKHGGKPTSWIEIYTDKAGNLITTYPIPKP